MLQDADMWWQGGEGATGLRTMASNYQNRQEAVACRIVRAFVRRTSCQVVRLPRLTQSSAALWSLPSPRLRRKD